MKPRAGGDENKLFGSGWELFMAEEHLRYYSVWWRPRSRIYKPVKINFTQEVDARRLWLFLKMEAHCFKEGVNPRYDMEEAEPFPARLDPSQRLSGEIYKAIVATVSSIFVCVVRAKS